jgi:hypothetical protein
MSDDIEMVEVSPCCASFANLMDGGYVTRGEERSQH